MLLRDMAFMGLVSLLAVSVSHTASAMTTDEAVQTLLGKSAGGALPMTEKDTGRIAPSMPATAMNDGERASMVVPRGATLAALVAPVLRQVKVPKAEVFQAFVRLNPQAFIGGNPNRLMAGATVHMFNEADIAALNGTPLPASAEQRRNWVRFP